MIQIKTIEPRIGQIWTSNDKKFQVTGLRISEDDAWIEYTNVLTEQAFSCRLEAFRARFQPQAD